MKPRSRRYTLDQNGLLNVVYRDGVPFVRIDRVGHHPDGRVADAFAKECVRSMNYADDLATALRALHHQWEYVGAPADHADMLAASTTLDAYDKDKARED